MNALTTLVVAAGALVGAVVATTFELLPERIDLIGFVLQGAGLLAILGTALALAEQRRHRRRGQPAPATPYAEYATVLGAAGGCALFFILLAIQEVR